MVQKLFNRQPAADARSGQNAEHTERAEEMQRTGQIARQETNGDEIKKDAESAGEPVMRNAALAVCVLDGHLADGSSMPGGQRGDKAVQLSIQRNLVEDLPTVGLESGAEVVDVHTAQFGHEPVGAVRRDAAEPKIVDAALAPAADDVIALGNLFQKQGDVGRVVLQVTVHGDDVFPASMIEACCQRRSLAEVAAQLDHRNPAIDRGDLAQHMEATVGGTVVHEHDLEGFAVALHNRFEAVVEVGDVLLLIIQGYYA